MLKLDRPGFKSEVYYLIEVSPWETYHQISLNLSQSHISQLFNEYNHIDLIQLGP